MEQVLASREGQARGIDRILSELAPFDIKLKPPDLRGRSVRRDVLSEEVLESTDIVVLTAGAGYGKTTLLAQSIRSATPWAWLTLHPEDNDPATLVAYLLRALQTAWAIPADEAGHLSDPGASEASVLLPRLSHLMASITGPGTLVLDEVGAIEDNRCLRILEAVLESAPPDLQILLSGRSLPVLGLERLRTKRRVLELHEHDLAFDYAETLAMVDAADLSVDPARLKSIHEAAEGWPAGVYLLALAAQGPASGGPTIPPALSVGAYVHEQVLSGLDASTTEFLVKTSILDLPDGASCDALLGRRDSAAVLHQLARSHLLVTPLADSTDSYRYHGLLTDVLRTELTRRHPDEVSLLHQRACEHFAAHDERAAAVRHALASGHAEKAAAVLWGYLPFMLGTGNGDTMASWLRDLRDEDYEQSPAFAVSQSLVASLAGDGQAARLHLALAQQHAPESPLPDGSPLAFYLHLLDALICDNGVAEMIRSAEAALAYDIGDSPLRNLPLHLRGCGLAVSGEPVAALPVLDEGIEVALQLPTAVLSGLAQKAFIAASEEDWANARRLVRRGRELYEHFRLEHLPAQARFNAIAAMIAVHDGDHGAAGSYTRHGRLLVGRMGDIAPWLTAETKVLLGHVELRLGHASSAAQLAKEARTALVQVPDAVTLAESLHLLEVALGSETRPSEALTTAEIRLLSFLPTHLTFNQIADELFVSVNTVKSQAKAVYRKLDAVSRSDAVARALASGLLDA